MQYEWFDGELRHRCEDNVLRTVPCIRCGAVSPREGDKIVPYDASEQQVLLNEFVRMLKSVTKDGGRKRARGEKPPWWCDNTHEAAIFSHLNKWKHGEKQDPDSGVHPLVHLAWRALAIAYQESVGQYDPAALPSSEG